MIKTFLIIVACLRPDFTYCEQMQAVAMPDPETCQLTRPEAAMALQLSLPKTREWLTFTRCELVNTEKNGVRG